MLSDFANGFGNLIHIGARAKQLSLRQPHGVAAELIVFRAMIPLGPRVEVLLPVNLLIAAGSERVLQERLFVERRIAAGCRDSFGRKSLQEIRARHPGEVLRPVAHHVQVVRVSRAAFVSCRRHKAADLAKHAVRYFAFSSRTRDCCSKRVICESRIAAWNSVIRRLAPRVAYEKSYPGCLRDLPLL